MWRETLLFIYVFFNLIPTLFCYCNIDIKENVQNTLRKTNWIVNLREHTTTHQICFSDWLKQPYIFRTQNFTEIIYLLLSTYGISCLNSWYNDFPRYFNVHLAIFITETCFLSSTIWRLEGHVQGLSSLVLHELKILWILWFTLCCDGEIRKFCKILHSDMFFSNYLVV